jgi:hypothetical protein
VLRRFVLPFQRYPAMANEQYLFRLYCEPTRRLVPVGGTLVVPESVDEHNPFDTTTIDHLVSLPPETTTLVEQANTLVQAYSALCIRNEVQFVAVFQLTPDKPADHDTPVMIVHPFYMQQITQPILLSQEGLEYDWENLHTVARITEDNGVNNWAINGFQSYNLEARLAGNTTFPKDPREFYVLSLSRACNIGRSAKHFVTRAVDPADVLHSLGGTLKLRSSGGLWYVRWPLYRQIMNRLPYQHSGYHVQTDGSVALGRIAMGDFIPAGVTFRQADRKRFLRRSRAVSKVMYVWWSTVTRLIRVLGILDNVGYSGARPGFYHFATRTQMYKTSVQHEFIKKNLRSVVDFINVVGVATGNNNLLLSEPDTTPGSRQADFYSLVDYFTNDDGTLSQYSVKGNTKNVQCFQSLHQLTANLIRRIADFQKAVDQWRAQPVPVIPADQIGHGHALSNIYTELAYQWPQMQGELYKILLLLLTWHLTFEPVEKIRAAEHEPQIIGLPPALLKPHQLIGLPYPWPSIFSWPNLATGRIAWDLPDFAPFRFWDVTIVDTNTDTAIANELARQEAEAIAAWRAYNEQQDAAARAARQHRRELEMQRAVHDWDDEQLAWQWWDKEEAWKRLLRQDGHAIFAEPMNDELRQRAMTETDTRLRFQLEDKRRVTPNQVYEYNYPGAPAEFITNAPPPDVTLPFCTYSRWIRRKVGSQTVDVKQTWTANGVEDYLNEMRFHEPEYSDVPHFDYYANWQQDYTE